MKFYKDMCLRFIKILNIGWATIAYFIIAIITIDVIDKIYGNFDEDKYRKMSTFELNKSTLLYLWVIGVLIYIVRNIFPLIPFPLDGIMGYDHNKVQEVTSANLYAIFIMLFNKRLQGYYSIIKERLFDF